MSLNRSKLISVLVLVAGLFTISTGALAQDPNLCDEPGEEPNLVVGDIADVRYWGTLGDISAFSISSDSCNLGTCWANWISNTPDHPVIAQNMYRLKNGRYEHIGQSWLKHGFFALSSDLCSPNCVGTNGDHLGVNCSDLYSSGLNGSQGGLGPKSEVNPSTGQFPFPPTAWQQTGNVIYKRLQVHNDDLDPALNPGAIYYVEGQYVAADEAQAGNGGDSSSLREVLVSGSPGNWDIDTTGTITVGKAGTFGWKRQDSAVSNRNARVPGDGDYWVASKATDKGDGTWNYEYVVHNLNSDRAAGSFWVPLPLGANISNIGFHDVDYHSGEPFDGTDWAGRVETDRIIWETTEFEDNANANALRWGTMYNFRFDADIPPTSEVVVIGLWKPGDPATMSVVANVPQVCDGDGICDPGETCQNCLSDCSSQGGGGGCCGSGVCDPGETFCSCPSDCGYPADGLFENNCADGVDDDCDGLIDCADSDCCSDAACQGADNDNDSFEACDCDDSNDQVWNRPSEVDTLTLDPNGGNTLLSWGPPVNPGGTSVTYQVPRSINAANFTTSTECLPSGGGSTSANDALEPSLGGIFCYLVRAHNACPAASGNGEMGDNSNNQPRAGVACP